MTSDPKLLIVTGHYGAGKTNFAVNLARDYAAAGEQVALFDLDIVNPYFRSSDFAKPLAGQGIEVVVPPFANSNVDLPTLTGRLDAVLAGHDNRRIILDVGGDDAGAIALGRYAEKIRKLPHRFLYVINCFRYLTREPEEALELLHEIEAASRLTAHALVNNSNLGPATTAADIEKGWQYAQDTAALTGLPVDCTTVPPGIETTIPNARSIEIFVKAPW